MSTKDQIVLNIPIAMRVLALCFWLGGYIILGAVVAPAIFRTLDNPVLSGQIFGKCLNQLNIISLIAAAMIFLAEIPSLRTKAPVSVIRLMFLLVAVGITLHLKFGLFPQVEKLREEGKSGTAAFDKLHQQYSQEGKFAAYALIPIAVLAGIEATAGKRK